jgi:hypothetical protein
MAMAVEQSERRKKQPSVDRQGSGRHEKKYTWDVYGGYFTIMDTTLSSDNCRPLGGIPGLFL